MNKKQLFNQLLENPEQEGKLLFRPLLMHFAARFNGKTYSEFASDHKVLVESNIRCMEFFDTDIVSLISDPYRETSAFGGTIEFIPEGVPKCSTLNISSIDEARALPIPDVYKCERTLDRILGARYYQELLKGTVPVSGWVEGPLAEACDLIGVSEMLMMLMTDTDLSNILLDKCLEMAKSFAKAQINEGCDLIGVGDAICSQIDIDTYNFYVKPRHRELFDFIHSSGSKVNLHICGNTTHLLPAINELKIDIYDPDWQVDLIEARKILGNEVVICGNINPVSIQYKPFEEIKSLNLELIQKMKGQKFIVSAGCEITVNTPVENLMALSATR